MNKRRLNVYKKLKKNEAFLHWRAFTTQNYCSKCDYPIYDGNIPLNCPKCKRRFVNVYKDPM